MQKLLKYLLMSVATVVMYNQNNLVALDYNTGILSVLEQKQHSKFEELLNIANEKLVQNIEIKAKACGLGDKYWAKKAVLKPFSKLNKEKEKDFSESIKNLGILVALSYVVTENQYAHIIAGFKNSIKQLLTELRDEITKNNAKIYGLDKEGVQTYIQDRYKEQIEKYGDEVAGLINAWIVFDCLVNNWRTDHSGSINGVYDQNEYQYKTANLIYNVKGDDIRRAYRYCKKEKAIKLALIDTLIPIGQHSLVSGIMLYNAILALKNKGEVTDDGIALFNHDWECYLEQFWVSCSGRDDKNNPVASVMKKTFNELMKREDKKKNVEIVKDLDTNKTLMRLDKLPGNNADKTQIIENNKQNAFANSNDVLLQNNVNQNSHYQNAYGNRNNIVNNNNNMNINQGNQVNSFNSNNQFSQANNNQLNLYNNMPYLNNMGIQNTQNYNMINNPYNNQGMNNNMMNMNINMMNNSQNNQFYQLGSKPAKGLENVGATCFRNATLQCLLHTKELTNYFLDENRRKSIQANISEKAINYDNDSLVGKYIKLVETVWNKDRANRNESYQPNEFMKLVEKQNPLFKPGEAGDAKDFIIYLLEQMHKELKKPVDERIPINEPQNQYKQRNALIYFFNEFCKETSIFSDNFFGINEATNTCMYCKNFYDSRKMNYPICYNYGIFNCLILPLEEVRKMVIDYCRKTNPSYSTNTVTLEQCFIYNQKTDYFTGDNQNYCNICRQLSNSEYTSKIYSAPKVLILILNRGKNNMYNVKLNFNQEIDITNYVATECPNRKDRCWKYQLFGVITHIGASGPNAHFVASCKLPNTNKWFRYNDAYVTSIKDFQQDVYDFATPYILCYELKEDKN